VVRKAAETLGSAEGANSDFSREGEAEWNLGVILGEPFVLRELSGKGRKNKKRSAFDQRGRANKNGRKVPLRREGASSQYYQQAGHTKNVGLHNTATDKKKRWRCRQLCGSERKRAKTSSWKRTLTCDGKKLGPVNGRRRRMRGTGKTIAADGTYISRKRCDAEVRDATNLPRSPGNGDAKKRAECQDHMTLKGDKKRSWGQKAGGDGKKT